jgi:hypothetical protein
LNAVHARQENDPRGFKCNVSHFQTSVNERRLHYCREYYLAPDSPDSLN